jgi:DNA polymerase I-like protein with 3'-5' exonuclease and polymerase domains
MRDDAIGMFWEEFDEFETRGNRANHPLPPIPDTGWKMPIDYPSLEGQGMISVDVETCDPDLRERGPGMKRGAYICGIGLGTEAGFRRYYPVAHQMGDNLPKDAVFAYAKQELARPVPKVGANILYDLICLTESGIPVTGPFFDVQVAEPLLNENKLSYTLESISQDHLKEGKKENEMKRWITRAFGSKNPKGQIYRAPAVVVGPYAEGDIDLPLRVFELQRKELERQNLWSLFMLESRLIPMLLAMWRRGVRVDIDKAEQLKQVLEGQQKQVLDEITKMTGIAPDIWAADSIAKIFDAAGVPYERTAKTDKPSFRKDWLEKCSHPIGKKIVQARRLDKYKGTFVEGYIINGQVNGFIHTSFHQLKSERGGTVSGRFSSSYPNLQNIPIRDEELGPLIRAMFIAEFGKKWWKFDWSQIEFRLAIHHAARLKLRGADIVVDQYMNDPNTDYHEVVAKITGLKRKFAKNINFGIIYGLGIDALADSLGVTIEEAERMYRDYLKRVPFIGDLRTRAMDAASKYGYINTLSGRFRRFDVWEKKGIYLPHKFPGAKRAFTHKALNARLQGDAADIMKTAMVDSWESGIFDDDMLGAPHLTVHDELDGSFEDTPQSRECLLELKHIMETCTQLLVPLRADGGTGPNWGAIE